ncbi:hypothetical protein [Halostella litorea]|uniref:hypothetical protein n=1 Tax=Halostella litorea TaxID=2528831 RepID=UPI001091A7D9|nr:hypothetical protein [Halostella litorea]
MVRDALLTYGVPFVGTVLLAAGIGAAVLGGYGAVQGEAGLCGTPLVGVESPEETERLLSGYGAGGPTLQRVAFENLSAAEREAFEEALDAPDGEGSVDGAFPNRGAFADGVLVDYGGETYYATLRSDKACTSVDPLLLPLGLAAMAFGALGVLTPPLYRRYAAFERRQAE